MDLREALNPQNDPLVNGLLDLLVMAMIALVTLIVVLFLWANLGGARRAFAESGATFASFLSAGIVLGVIAVLTLIGMKVGPAGWPWFFIFWLIGVVLLWDRVYISGNILLDTLLPAAVIALIGSYAVNGIGAIFSGAVGFDVLPTLAVLIAVGAVVARVIGWINN